MTGTSILWVGSGTHGDEARLRTLRGAGWFPVAVQSADEALRLLRQFRVRIVVLHASAGSGWQECARVLGCGSPVAMVVDAIEPESTGRYLSAGCAAVIAASCTPDELTAALARVADGRRDVVCPVPSTHALASVSHRSSPVG